MTHTATPTLPNDDQVVLTALAEGLPQRLSRKVTAVAIDRRVVRSYSRVLFCTVNFADATPLRCVAKLVTGPSDSLDRQRVLMARDFKVNQHLHAAFADSAVHAVPTPLLFEPDLNLIVTAFEAGTRLQDRLVAGARGWPSTATMAGLEADCEACGAWIDAFQRATVSLVSDDTDFGRSLEMIDASTCAEQVAVCLERLAAAGESPFSSTQERDILDFVVAQAGQSGEQDRPPVGIHSDFFAGNVLRDGRRTVGIDFIMFRRGIRLVDPSYYLLQLETLAQSPTVRGRTVQRLRHAFLRGFDPSLDADRFWTSSPAARMVYVLHRVRRLWGMAGERAAPHRALFRRMQSEWTARSLLRHVRGAASSAAG